MMNNLFSIFDPSTSLNYSNNWISSLYVYMYMPLTFWFVPSRNFMILMKILKILINEFKILLMKKINFMSMILMMSIFFNIFLNNFLGLFPYIFTSSSHLIYSLSYSLILWISLMIYGWINNTNHMFSHLVPQGTPMMLMSFMVIVESLSNLIRSGTLSIRLSANMIAGHLLMTLISSSSNNLSELLLILMIISQSILIILELSVSLIQSYVFTVLSILYKAEVN